MPDPASSVQSTCDNNAPGGRYVQLRGGVLDQWCRDHGISPADRAVLAHLVLEADWRTGVVDDFSLTRCSAELGMGGASGRRTLGLRIARLAAAGAVTYRSARGHVRGAITVLLYQELVRTSRPHARAEAGSSARKARATSGSSARKARATSGSSARKARASRPHFPLSPAASSPEDGKDEDNYRETTSLSASSSSSSTEADRLCFELILRLESNGDRPPPVDSTWHRAAGEILSAAADLDEALSVLAYATADPFWSPVVRTMPKFAKHYGQLRARARAARVRPVANPLTAPTEDRQTCGVVSM